MQFHKNINESGLLRAADTGYAFRFIKLLITPWEDTKAFELGIVDEKGKRDKTVKLDTKEKKEAYTIFHRLVYNIKRLVGNNKFTSYVSALFLIKENSTMDEGEILHLMNSLYHIDDTRSLAESWFIGEDSILSEGQYTLVNDIASPITGEVIAQAGTTITVAEQCKPVSYFLGFNIYEVKHIRTNQLIFVTSRDLTK